MMVCSIYLRYLYIVYIYCCCRIIVIDDLKIVNVVFFVVPVVLDMELTASCIGNDVMEVSVGDGDRYVVSFVRDECISE